MWILLTLPPRGWVLKHKHVCKCSVARILCPCEHATHVHVHGSTANCCIRIHSWHHLQHQFALLLLFLHWDVQNMNADVTWMQDKHHNRRQLGTWGRLTVCVKVLPPGQHMVCCHVVYYMTKTADWTQAIHKVSNVSHSGVLEAVAKHWLGSGGADVIWVLCALPSGTQAS